MDNSINSQTDNLVDIVGMNAIIEPTSVSPFIIMFSTILIMSLLLMLYYQFMHGFKGQLRHIQYQLNHAQISPREAAHKIAPLIKENLNNHSISDAQLKALKTFRFASKTPSHQQIIEFINHVD